MQHSSSKSFPTHFVSNKRICFFSNFQEMYFPTGYTLCKTPWREVSQSLTIWLVSALSILGHQWSILNDHPFESHSSARFFRSPVRHFPSTRSRASSMNRQECSRDDRWVPSALTETMIPASLPPWTILLHLYRARYTCRRAAGVIVRARYEVSHRDVLLTNHLSVIIRICGSPWIFRESRA